MNELNLSEAFKIISADRNQPDYITEIYRVLSEKGNAVDRKELDNILLEYNVDYHGIKEDFLNVILDYARLVLKDGIISQAENTNLIYLKRLFKIEEGYFFKYKNSAIKEVIQSQLYKLYFDETIDNKEALFKAELQEFFDLSYEQMATFVNPVAEEALERGADISELDTVFPDFHSRDKKKLLWRKIVKAIGFKR